MSAVTERAGTVCSARVVIFEGERDASRRIEVTVEDVPFDHQTPGNTHAEIVRRAVALASREADFVKLFPNGVNLRMHKLWICPISGPQNVPEWRIKGRHKAGA